MANNASEIEDEKTYMTFSIFGKYQELTKKFRNIWNLGSTGAFEGVSIFNEIVELLHKHTYLSIREIVFYFLLDNSDLLGLKQSNLISYLNREYKILYKKRL